jgi:hypothetical protein
LRLAPPARWVVVKTSPGIESIGGAGPRIDGRFRNGEPSRGVGLRRMLGDFSPRGILLGEDSFDN